MARIAGILAALAAALGACTSTPEGAPDWYAERAADNSEVYPSLRDVPEGTLANTDPAYWAALEAEVRAAGAAMKAHPRSEPVPPGHNPGEFISEAREDLEQSRAAHPDQ